MAEQDKTYVPGYWRAAKNTRTKKEKSSKPEKVKTITVTKEGPLTKQQFGKITLNSIRLARNLSALPSIAKEIKTFHKNLKTISENGGFDGKGKRKKGGKGSLDLSKLLDKLGTGASAAYLGAYAAATQSEETPQGSEGEKPQEYKQSVYDTKSLEQQAAEEREAYSQGSNQQQPVPVAPPPPAPPAPLASPAPPKLSSMVQNAMPGATLRQQAGLPAMISTTPSAAPAAPALRPGEVSGTIRRTDSSTGGGRGYINPELVRGTDIEIPANVVRDGQGNPVRTEDGGFVVSGQPGVAIPNPPAPVRPAPPRPAPTPAPVPSRPAPTPAPVPPRPAPTPAPVRKEPPRKSLKDAVEDKEFMKGLDYLAKKYNSTIEDLLSFMVNESEVNPAAQNTNGKASGLIQIMPNTLSAMKKAKLPSVENISSVDDIIKLSRAEQIPLIDDYFKLTGLSGNKGKTDLTTLYTAVFLPAFKYKPDNFILGIRPGITAPDGTKSTDTLYYITTENGKKIPVSYGRVYKDNPWFDLGAAKAGASWRLDPEATDQNSIVGGKGYYTRGDVGIKAGKNTSEVQSALQGANIGTMSQENTDLQTQTSRPTVNIPQQSQPSNQASGTIRRTTQGNRRTPVDWSQQAVPRQLGGS